MKIHPKIRHLIDCIHEAGIDDVSGNETKVLSILKNTEATQTEAVITIHLGFNVVLAEAEKIVYPSKVWGREELSDIAYQTFLYMNYNPSDSDFSYDEEKVRFSLFTNKKNK